MHTAVTRFLVPKEHCTQQLITWLLYLYVLLYIEIQTVPCEQWSETLSANTVLTWYVDASHHWDTKWQTDIRKQHCMTHRKGLPYKGRTAVTRCSWGSWNITYRCFLISSPDWTKHTLWLQYTYIPMYLWLWSNTGISTVWSMQEHAYCCNTVIKWGTAMGNGNRD